MALKKAHPPYPNFICSLWAVLWWLLLVILIFLANILLQHFLWNSSIKLLHSSLIVLIKWNWTNKTSKIGHFRHNTRSPPSKKWQKCKQILKLKFNNYSFLRLNFISNSLFEEDKEFYRDFCHQIFRVEEYRELATGILRHLFPAGTSHKMLQDLIIANHYFLHLMEKSVKLGELLKFQKKKREKKQKKTQKRKHKEQS